MYPGEHNSNEIDGIETQLGKLVDEKNLLEQPAFKEVAAFAQKSLGNINALLLNDETLLNDKGRLLSNQRDFWRVFLKAVSVDAKDSAISYLVDSEIDSKLNS